MKKVAGVIAATARCAVVGREPPDLRKTFSWFTVYYMKCDGISQMR